MLKRDDLPAEFLARVGDWIEEALRWEPNNEFIWTFWADCLAWQGREKHQEWVLREAVRLFPDNAPSSVELARLLMRRGEAHWREAEHWLREAAQRNPDNEASRVELARLLMEFSSPRPSGAATVGKQSGAIMAPGSPEKKRRSGI